LEGSERADPSEPDRWASSTPSVEAMEAEICREVLAIHIESYTRAPARVRAHIWEDLVIVVLDGLELQPSEEFLVGEGNPEAVTTLRNRFEESISANFQAVVERATGRPVVGFTSQQHVSEPRFALAVFRMSP
jgi:uncharacterized protein YbcI